MLSLRQRHIWIFSVFVGQIWYRFMSRPLQEHEFHHDSLLKPVHLELTNVQVDFFMTSGH
jgi:hypothetical protein